MIKEATILHKQLIDDHYLMPDLQHGMYYGHPVVDYSYDPSNMEFHVWYGDLDEVEQMYEELLSRAPRRI